jgi:hypothetical protein
MESGMEASSKRQLLPQMINKTDIPADAERSEKG